ncbi:hypothetical protein MATL_G00166200 [Megalops atlanticus]|uniref:Neuronal PAS domain-containing protein 4 n=1 Tax=Megalops atlanticus TaxID=7932 RepID=A0A9D3T2R6_MEGAT|nr:hypothetical protein MATL_G00166200 [Megalops atlanticus]
MYRSTKGASKARRDQINAEIRNLKDLLPISDADKARLSYLHIMSLACMYTRKSVFFSQEATESGSHEDSARFLSFQELSELVHAMPGFLLLLTGEGKMLYLSDSVAEHLGHSMVDLVAQGDSVYDIIDPSDHFVMRSNLTPTTSPDTDRLFRCHFNTSKSARRQSAGNKLVLIRARCLTPPCPTSSPASYWTSNPVWVCFCSPLEPHLPRPVLTRETVLTLPADHAFFLACFHSQHSRDMRLQEAQDSVTVYLGFDVAVLRSRSWYSLLHPQDLSHASAQHCSLRECPTHLQMPTAAPSQRLREGGEGRVEMVVRVEAVDKSWVWLYMVLQLEAGEHPISCHNYVISESEAWSVRQQISSEQTQLTLVLSASTSYQDSTSLQSPDTLSSPDQVFTPSSSGLSVQSFDFSTSVCGTGSSEEQGGAALECARPKGDPRSSLSSLEEESFFQQQSGGPPASPASSSSPTPVTVATVESCSGGLYEKLPPTPDSPGDGDCTVMTLPEVRGPLHVCSVQSAHCNRRSGGGADAGAAGEGGSPAGEGADMEAVPLPLSSTCSIPPSPPLLLTASPAASAPATPVTPVTPAVPGLPCAQSLLEELAALEPVFGAGASIAPGLGQQPELYQLQCHPPPQHFHEDGSGSDPPF